MHSRPRHSLVALAVLALVLVAFVAFGARGAPGEGEAVAPAAPASFYGAWARSDGLRGHSPGLAADGIFWIGSLSKTFAAAATLRLVERGALALEAPVEVLLPGLGRIERGGEVCTIARLLRHTCGLPEELPERACLLGHLEDPARRACFIAALNRVGPATAPGSQFRYSNVGYDLLGLILGEVSGLSYEALLQREFFAPLEMHDTGITLPPARAQRLVRGEMVLFGLSLDAAAWNLLPVAAPARFGASGNLHSSVDDLLRWTEALHRGGLLSAGSYAQMIEAGEGDYGYGLVISERPFGRVLWHSGSLSPFSYNGFVGWSVAREQAVVVLSARSPAISRSGLVAEALWLGEPAREPTLLEHLRAALVPAGLLLGLPVIAFAYVRRSLRAGVYPRLEWLLAHHTLLIAAQFLLARFREPAGTWIASGALALLGLLGVYLALPALARAPWLGARPRRQVASLALSLALCVALLVIAPIELAWTQAALVAAEALMLARRSAALRRRVRADAAPS